MNPSLTSERVYLGIDPGKTGAIAIFCGRAFCDVYDMPTTTHDLGSLFRRLPVSHPGFTVTVLEKQQAMPKQGVSSTFKLAQHYGELRGVLAALGIPFIDVRPVDWKRHYRLTRKDKDASRALAQERWPSAPLGRKKDHGRAEAMLLAQYGLDLWPAETNS